MLGMEIEFGGLAAPVEMTLFSTTPAPESPAFPWSTRPFRARFASSELYVPWLDNDTNETGAVFTNVELVDHRDPVSGARSQMVTSRFLFERGLPPQYFRGDGQQSRLEGEVRAIGRGGDAVVETATAWSWFPVLLPGERVELRCSPSKRGAARGRLKRVLAASDARASRRARTRSSCGGCPLMIADPELQREVKRSFLRDACRGHPGADEAEPRLGGLGPELRVPPPSPASPGIATRSAIAQLHSKRVTDIDECVVLVAPLRAAWSQTCSDARRYPAVAAARSSCSSRPTSGSSSA